MDDTDYAFGRSRAEYDRLIEQAELLRPLTERMLLAAGIRSGMHVLDVGCGVGDVGFLVASLVGPKGSVVGVDLDGEAIKFARERCTAQGIANVEFQQSDARSVESERLFDAAVGRFVLQFMSDPTAALRLIAERVCAGGILAFHEGDFQLPTAPAMNQPVLARLQDLFTRTFERSGSRPGTGTELYSHMLDAGLEPYPKPLAEIAVHMGQGEVAYRRWALFARSMLPKMVQYGFASEEEIHDIIDNQLRDELVPARGLVPLSWLMIGQWARKPGAGTSSRGQQ
jgi:ubiquinone/menaquinone biosynthesis C-methylase UbiE